MNISSDDHELETAWNLFETTLSKIQTEQLQAFEETLSQLDDAELVVKRNHVLRCYDNPSSKSTT